MNRLRLRVSSLLKGFVLALIFSVFLQASLASASGEIFIISTKTQLAAIGIEGEEGTPLSGQYVVTQSFVVDADAAGNTYIAGPFTGTFTGLFYGFISTISGLTKPLFDVIGGDISDLNLASGTGEFGVIGNGALANILEAGGTIDNISFTGDVTGVDNVGGLVGDSMGSITNSSATGAVDGTYYVGGLVGILDTTGTITNSYATGDVDGDEDWVGGLVGYSDGTITNSYAAGTVDGTYYVGGLVGESTSTSTITDSYAAGTVDGVDTVGGLVGYSGGTITDSYATGDVDGTNYVGGLVGILDTTGTITDSYAAGTVGGVDSVGGLVGYSDGTITNSSATVAVTGTYYVGGLVGDQDFGTISNSSATSTVDGFVAVGGLVGRSKSDITNSSATGTVGGTNMIGGLVGESTSTSTITNNSYATGTVGGVEFVGGLVGYLAGAISNSSATGVVDGDNTVGGLVGESTGDIDNSYATGDVTGNDNVGGLVGLTNGTIDNSYATGDVIGSGDYIGGLVGWLGVGATISNSYAKTGTVTGTGTYDGNFWDGGFDEGDHGIGGLVGYSSGYISDSYAEGNVNGFKQVGGLVGSTGTPIAATEITDSYATGTVTGSGDDVGGLVGLLDLGYTITNSYAAGTVEGTNDVGGLVGYSEGTITNSYATGAVTGTGENSDSDLDYSDVGGLVGENFGPIINSYATGDVTGGVVDFTGRLYGFSDVGIDEEDSYGTGSVNNAPYLGESAPEILSIVNYGVEGSPPFTVDSRINLGRPYLISLEDSYDVAVTPSNSLRSFYTQAAKSLDKALTSLGFKSNFSSHPNLGFQALEQSQSNSPAVIQLFEVSEYQNSNILLNKADGLQLSISSYYKESVEIWTQGLNGEYLYLGLVEFDKDGKAILPTLKFDTANTYQLLMIKAADKLSEKPNLEAQIGEITINVF